MAQDKTKRWTALKEEIRRLKRSDVSHDAHGHDIGVRDLFPT